MNVLKTVKQAKKQVESDKSRGFSIGLVPTMGALHEGHLSLVEASEKKCDRTYVSIFINPKQFNEQKDLDNYPVELESDLAKLEIAGVDHVFTPSATDMYPDDLDFPVIELGAMDRTLEGAMRPGHFEGVAKVVYRLFDILRPDCAFFGQKDFQQTIVVRQLVDQLQLPVEIVVCPIIREPNGLAMSSRNSRLSAHDRAKAGFLYKSLVKLKEDCHHMPLTVARDKAVHYLQRLPHVKIEYFATVNGHTMEEVNDLSPAYVVCVAVVRFGGIRMLDNIVLKNEV